MNAFSYLSVLLSIILGLAITQVLQGYRGLLLSRSRVAVYLPPLIWSALMLVFVTQSWWASFGLADHQEWTFATFSIILLQTVLLYMMAAVVLPDTAGSEPIDLRAHYYDQVKPFFGLSLAMLAASVAKDWMLDSRLPEGLNLAFHLFYAALASVAMLVRHPRLH